MTWFKVDDGFHDHPKTEDLPDSAVALWTRAGSWCARHLTDGFVPERRARRSCDNPDEGIAALLTAGLWIKVDGGYQFHDWGAYQPTRAEKEAERKAGAERQARWRERRQEERAVRDKTDDKRRDQPEKDAVSNAVTNTVVDRTRNADPTRPDPTRPEAPTELQNPAASAAPEQATLGGMPDRSPPAEREHTPEDMAFGVARWRIEERAAAGAPVIGGGRKGALHTLKNILVDAFVAQYTEAEVREALSNIRDGIPSKQQLNRELVAIRLKGANDQGRAGTDLTRRPSGAETRRSTSALRAEQALAVADALDRKYGHGKYAPGATA